MLIDYQGFIPMITLPLLLSSIKGILLTIIYMLQTPEVSIAWTMEVNEGLLAVDI